MESPEVIIVGAGIAGLGVGWRVALDGRRVLIFDAGEAGRESTWAAGGMLAPAAEIAFEEMDLYELQRESLARWRSFAVELERASGRSVGYRTDGTLVVADDRDSAVALKRVYDFQREHGVPVEWLDVDDALDLEPMLSPRLTAVVSAPTDHQVDNRAAADALLIAARRAGAEVREHAPVSAIEQGGARLSVVLADGQAVTADVVVLAAGAWSGSISGLDPAPPVRPVKGQALSVRQTQRPGLQLRHVVRGPRAYLVPKDDGRVVVGATSEERGFDKSVTVGGVFRLLEAAIDVVPGVEEMEIVETWAGLRPACRDHRPLLGRSHQPRIVYATGLFRHGILLAPVTADEVAREVVSILNGSPETPSVLAPFSPLRFN